MLEWFVSMDAAEKYLDGEIIDTIERKPDNENVNIFEIRKHFTSNVWKAVPEI